MTGYHRSGFADRLLRHTRSPRAEALALDPVRDPTLALDQTLGLLKEANQRIHGLEDELEAVLRENVILRAAQGFQAPGPSVRLRSGAVVNTAYRWLERGDKHVRLSDREWEIVAHLLRAPRPVSSLELRQVLYGGLCSPGAVATMVQHLRLKMKQVDAVSDLANHAGHVRRGHSGAVFARYELLRAEEPS